MRTSRQSGTSRPSVRARASRPVTVAVAAGLLVAWTGPVAFGTTADPLVTVTVTGTIENVVVDDDGALGAASSDGATAVETFVQVDGVLHDLPDGTVVPPGPTGEDVVISLAAARGVTGTHALELAAQDVQDPAARVLDVLPVTGAATTEPAAGAGTADTVLGAHTLTVLPVTWGAPDVSIPALAALAADTAAYWSEQSAGRLSITPVVQNWAAIPDPGSCNVDGIFNAAMAANPGVGTPTMTNHVLAYFPRRADCPFAGRASLLGGRIWVNGTPLIDVTAHELGHNLGLGHANQASCTFGGARVPLSGSCAWTEYADRADLMGYATSQRSGNLNSALADSLGFAQVTALSATLVGATTVQLAPLGEMSAMRAVKIHVPTGDVYVDFRPSAGRDVRVPAWAGVQVHLRTTDGWGIPTTYLLDMQSGAQAFAAPALPAGATWVVPDSGLMVTVTGVGATATVRVAPAVGLEQYVTRVYGDLFNRVPDPQGLATWTSALRAGTPRVAVANSITYSAEYRTGLINGSYRAFLGREAEPAGLAHWLGEMTRGMIIQQMEGGFLASQEYYNQSGGDDAQWVTRLYGHVLGRTAAPPEVSFWVSRVRTPGVNRYAVAMGFLLSTERLGTVMDGYYQHLLGRGIDPSGRQSWVGQIQGGVRVEAVIGGLIASEEYFGRS